ncbi:uncharacterized protein BDV17DRAFT_288954 [Aspergillus undulatus]|uniref:uncharacterized protein n=1 Tax=Aspergillus undulatus TaxID=1810928 RepID=UPI003CCD64CD
MFSDIISTAEAGLAGESNATVPVRFLTRYDKSATSIEDSALSTDIRQVPWALAYSKWYHQYADYPVQALTAAILFQEYTITDRRTYLVEKGLHNQTVTYTDESHDRLLNPAHILIEPGRGVITEFKKNGQQLYTAAPEDKTAHF